MTIRTTSDLAGLIRDRRKTLRADQKTLAARVGVSRKWIVDIEKGKARADLGLVLRTLEVLGVRLQPVTVSKASGSPVSADAIVEAARRRTR